MQGHADSVPGDAAAHRGTGAVLEREFEAIQGVAAPPLAPQERREVRAAHPPPPPGASPDVRAKWAEGVADAEVQAAYRLAVHRLPDAEAPAALCLSGGGIRSAAFALGVVQGLAQRGLLSKLHYLSTVSGGGYTGAWLTAWVHREARMGTPFSAVEERVGTRTPHATEEAGPLAWLRSHQKFLTPGVGLGSADTWAAVAIFVRDLLLNWLVFVPLLAALLLLPHLLHTGLQVWAGYAGQPPDSSLNRLALQAVEWLQRLPAAPLQAPLGWLRRGLETGSGDGVADLPWPAWADGFGALLVGVGLVAAMANRSTQGPRTMGGRGFGWLVLLPIVAGASLLLMQIAAWAPGRAGPPPRSLVQYVVLCPVVFVAARLIVAAARLLRGGAPMPGTRRLSLAVEVLAFVPTGAFVGVLIWCGLWLRHRAGGDGFGDYRDLAAFGVPWLLVSLLGGQVLYAGLVSRTAFGRCDQEWLARASGHYLLVASAWTFCAGTVLYGIELGGRLTQVSLLAAGTGTITLATALSSLTKATAALKTARERVPVSVLVSVACLVFLSCGAVLLSHGTMRLFAWLWLPWGVGEAAPDVGLGGWLYDDLRADWRPALLEALRADTWPALLALAATSGGLLLLSAVASVFVNVNLFSLHALYRNRLVRTFLGASNVDRLTGEDAKRNNFDDFSPGDNLRMGELWRDRRGRPMRPGGRRPGPFPVVNMTLNLLDTKNLAWRDRKAASFISTPLHTGGDLVGYRDSRLVASQPSPVHWLLGIRKGDATAGVSLGTAMAISGAAASPNWGYHSSPLVGFIMMLFNVRLGWWLGNPESKRKWLYHGPFLSFKLFLQEALGQTSDLQSYVYLSDGGHFDNLGIYEMVRRRCRTIIVSDATADSDATLEDLGRSVRQVSIDLGVPITFERIGVRKRGESAGVYCAIGTIHYAKAGDFGAKPGRILYIKPGLYDDAPADVRAYAAANAKFPHDSTLNQFFTESQFESYRALGSHVIGRICGQKQENLTMQQLFDRAKLYLKGAEKNGKPVEGTSTGKVPPPAARQRRLRLIS